MKDRVPDQNATREGAGERFRVGADEIRLRVTSAASDGELLAAEVTMPAGGGPPLLHSHACSEVYRVEAGELAIYVEDADGRVHRHASHAGATVHIAGGRRHTIRNETGAEARAYVVYVPGAQMEGFVRAVAGASADGPPSPADVVAAAERHGIEMTGPVDAPEP